MRPKEYQRLRVPKGKHLVVEEHTVEKDFPIHWHSFFEIEILLSGSGRSRVNDVTYEMTEYPVFLLTSTDFHDLEVDRFTRLLNVTFDEEMIDEKDLALLMSQHTERAYAMDEEDYERIVKAAELLLHEYRIDGDCQKPLLQYLLRCILRQNYSNDASLGGEQSRGIKRAIMYMELHFREPVSLERLAAEAGYHPSYFSELFRRVTGEGYLAMLTRLRLSHAKALLANGFSVSDACFLSGFGSLSQFGSVFKAQCGMSPGQYRKAQGHFK
ncbi:MAG: helix-turn-helix domain-containing protein [Clostridia bacterium]|nr:helix-turn-helix domain-containing protein [Clostridia bacterium]